MLPDQADQFIDKSLLCKMLMDISTALLRNTETEAVSSAGNIKVSKLPRHTLRLSGKCDFHLFGRILSIQ